MPPPSHPMAALTPPSSLLCAMLRTSMPWISPISAGRLPEISFSERSIQERLVNWPTAVQLVMEPVRLLSRSVRAVMRPNWSGEDGRAVISRRGRSRPGVPSLGWVEGAVSGQSAHLAVGSIPVDVAWIDATDAVPPVALRQRGWHWYVRHARNRRGSMSGSSTWNRHHMDRRRRLDPSRCFLSKKGHQGA